MSGPDPVRDRGGIDIGFLEMSTRPRVAVGAAVTSRRPRTNAPVQRPGTPRSYPTGAAPRAIAALSRVRGRARPGAWPRPRDHIVPRGENGAREPRRPAPCALARQRRPPPVRACRRGVDGRRDARPPRDRPGARPDGPGAARRREPRVRLVVRPPGLAAGDARAAVVGRGGPAGEPGASAPPDRPPPDGLLGGRRVRGPVRRGLRARRLRHHAVLDAHGPAPAADAGRAAAPAARRPDHAAPPGLDARGAPPLDPARAPLHGRPPAVVPGGVVDRVRGGHVGQPLLAAVRPRPREPVGAPPRARPVPRRGAAVLVAGHRARPVAVEAQAVGPDPVRGPRDAPEHVPRPRDLHGLGAPVRALRDDQPHLGPHAARGPAGRRRDHVGRRGHRVHHDPDRDDLAVDARRGAPERRRGSAARGGARGDPRARGPPRGQARGARRRARARRPGRRPADQASGGIGAWRYSR